MLQVRRQSKTRLDGLPTLSLDEIELFEGGPVIWPANRATSVEAVKSLGQPAAGAKSLYGFAAVIRAQAEIESNLRFTRRGA